jgi:hypothetical protein
VQPHPSEERRGRKTLGGESRCNGRTPGRNSAAGLSWTSMGVGSGAGGVQANCKIMSISSRRLAGARCRWCRCSARHAASKHRSMLASRLAPATVSATLERGSSGRTGLDEPSVAASP